MTDRLVLVTGATGYVGSVLTPLLAQSCSVRAFDTEAFGNSIVGTPNVEFVKGDIRDCEAVSRALEGVTDVIHLAGIVTDDLVAMNPKLGQWVNNGAMGFLCAEAAKHGIRRFVYASSSSIYGTHESSGVQHHLRGCSEKCEPAPMTEYARQKLLGEEILNRYKDSMAVVSIRSATACGPAPRMRLDTIVNTFSAQAYFAGEITVHGGAQWRTNIHVSDVASLYCRLLEVPRLHSGQVYNATAGNQTALELAVLVAEVIPCKVTIDRSKKDDRHYRMSAGKLNRMSDWVPSLSIRQAVMDNLAWFQAGHIKDWQDDIYWNSRRMKNTMMGVV